MARQRTTKGSAGKGGAHARKGSQKAKPTPRAAREVREEAVEPLADGTARRDIAGVVLAVVAVASFIAVVAPASAPVTSAVSLFYHSGFGVGAYVLPVSLLVVAASLFVRSGAPLRVRSALGAVLIFVSVISIVSLLGLPAQRVAGVTVGFPELASTGGYVGMWVSGALLSLFGTAISLVILIGLALAGLVVIGFSLSELAEGIRDRSEARASARRVVGNETPWGEPLEGPVTRNAVQDRIDFGSDAAETTFLGSRTTTLLDSQGIDYGEDAFVDVSDQLAAEEAKTTLLPETPAARRASAPVPPARREAADRDEVAGEEPATRLIPIEDKVAPADSAVEAPAVAAAMAVPAFLQEAARKATVSQQDDGETQEVSGATPADSAGEEADGTADGENTADAAPARKRVTGAPHVGEHALPPMSMLRHNPASAASGTRDEELEQTAAALQSTLSEFNLHARVVGWISGPTVTTFKVQPGEGERVNRISNLEDDIALSLATTAVRIFAPIPGTSLVGIEIPNKTRQNVCLGDVLPYAKGGPLELAIGRDSEGLPIVADLAKMPHLLIAGTTGSGKSVMINAIISSMLMRATAEEVRLIMVDPKRVELAGYNGLPHLYVPVVTEPKQAASALQWGVAEMERRLKIFERLHVRNIGTFNEKQQAGDFDRYDNPPARMPYLVIIIDELSDLMMVAGKDVEASIVRIAQLGRAAGIHLIVATQRPSADVVTGLIKANIINRIAFNVGSGIDSRVIIDQTGAEKLIGYGDMLFSKVGWSKPKRIQGCYVSDEEIAEVVDFLKENGVAEYHEEILSAVSPAQQGGGGSGGGASEDDPLLWDAARIVVESGLGSTSGLQRRLKVGYARAGRIMDMLEEHGVVGPPDGSKPREVLLDAEGLEALERFEHENGTADEAEVF